MEPRRSFLAWVVATVLVCAGLAAAQESDPIASDDVFDVGANKFLTRTAADARTIEDAFKDEDPVRSESCPVDLELSWMTEVSASVYATPIIADLYSDNHKDVVVPSFVHYLEVLEGFNGAKAAGWPVNHKSTLHNSPVVADCDFDGVPDIIIVTYSAEVVCFSDSGKRLLHAHLPGLELRKDWYVGLKPDHVDHDHPDVSDSAGEELLREVLMTPGEEEVPAAEREVRAEEPEDGAGGPGGRRRLMQFNVREAQRAAFPANLKENTLSDEAEESFQLLSGEDEFDFAEEDEFIDEVRAEDYDEAYDDYGDDEAFREDLDRYGDHYDDDWDEDYYEDIGFHHPEGRAEDYITVDPHVLCTPTVVDIDGDGYEDLVVAVTYLFDHEVYADPGRREELGEDVDIGNYLAGGILAFDLITHEVKWHTHLDLSTHHVNFQAYMYSSPTVADLNADGKPEIVVGTSVGFVYVLDQNGTSMSGWPVQMGEVQAQVVVEDVNDDGALEIVACDSRGNVAAFSAAGVELWERHLGSLVANNPTVGDVNGDGATEVVVGTGSGTIFALDGATGRVVLSYQTNAMIMSSVLLAKLDDSAKPGLHLVTMSFDGFLYLVDGTTGCADVVDIGETSYSMVLFDDLDNDGFMDLLVSTMNGNVYCFKTRSRHDPLKVWASQVHEGNGFATKLDRESVAFTVDSRVPRDVSGQKVALSFEVRDKLMVTSSGDPKGLNGPYKVTLKLKGVGIEDMNAGTNPVVGVTNTFEVPGEYTMEIPCPRSRTTATIEVLMEDRHGKRFSDSFSLSFHMSYYRILKWLLALPVIATALVIISFGRLLGDYNRDRGLVL